MPFTFFDLIYWTLFNMISFVIAKFLIQDLRIRIKESVYIILASLLFGILSILILWLAPDFFAFDALIFIPLALLYFCKIKSYSVKKAITLVFITLFLAVVANMFMVVVHVLVIIQPQYLESANAIQISAIDFLGIMPFVALNHGFAILVTVLFVKLTKRWRERINNNEKAQTVLAVISTALIMIMSISAAIMQFQNEFVDFITSWELYFLFGFSATTFISFYFYMRSEREKMALRQKETEQEALQYYTQQIEQQQRIVRQFKHDQQNVLLSMEGYLETDNLAGLKEYFYSRIKVATEAITKDNFTLDRLSNIKIPEIKATLAGKLMIAQSAGIDTAFEARDEIDHIAVDSLALVRMLGIIMDNAIEELTTLGTGKIDVACYKTGGGVTFVVLNTCRADIQKLHELGQIGFSTKGEGRGLGLNNLADIAASHENITLQTNITGGNFIQKLRIGGTE